MIIDRNYKPSFFLFFLLKISIEYYSNSVQYVCIHRTILSKNLQKKNFFFFVKKRIINFIFIIAQNSSFIFLKNPMNFLSMMISLARYNQIDSLYVETIFFWTKYVSTLTLYLFSYKYINTERKILTMKMVILDVHMIYLIYYLSVEKERKKEGKNSRNKK